MAEADIGYPGGGTPALAADSPADASLAAAKPSSYCGECGSWGAHGARCAFCGYDFYADPVDGAPLD